jgi:hypothetical protein
MQQPEANQFFSHHDSAYKIANFDENGKHLPPFKNRCRSTSFVLYLFPTGYWKSIQRYSRSVAKKRRAFPERFVTSREIVAGLYDRIVDIL